MAATQLELRNRIYGYLNDLQSTTVFTGAGDRFPAYVVNSVINDTIRHYVNLLNGNYQGYLSTTLSFNVLASVRDYDLGATFRSPIYAVRRTINQVNYPLTPFQDLLTAIDLTPIPNTIWLPSYYLEGNHIVFNQFPESAEVGAFTVRFQGKVAPLVVDADPLPDTLYDMEDCAVLRSVLRLLRAKDVSGALKAVTGWKEELLDAEAVFWSQVGNRYVRPDRPIPIQYPDEIFI